MAEDTVSRDEFAMYVKGVNGDLDDIKVGLRDLTDTMNRRFRGNLVETAVGGRGGGGSRITPLGIEVLRRYREMESKATASVREELDAFTALLEDPPRET